ncbi:GtrA family protein [Variovorax sp. H27-G14]|uniref:GtrA family protein n=1 Tax=Variovorax sp. H27-G14 TaxID=3111914 RepID=UPI0038FC73C8
MKIGREFLSFAVVGVAGLVVDVVVLYLLAPLLGWYVARGLSFLAAATATWALNRRYTFAERRSDVPVLREYLGYLVTMLGGAAVNYSAYVLVLHWVTGAWAPAAGVALGSCAGLALNFLSARYLVFRAK